MAHPRSSNVTAPSPQGVSEGRPIELGAIPKNSREVIRITAEHFKGRDIINFRVWYRDDAGEMRPGKQGLAFRTDLLPAVLKALGQVHSGGDHAD
ncbi:transcriptional coactivator p15/PC4 family protein [Paracoccus actinidiae]|jgi:hypothetical protein|uniref:transcriptional coactivator p15/PC4 family protein n=1 Tax=Paracoccus actinidiae TaxID=3064531 RepID=UPI0027D2E856|nr:transcriptional coactivator p15/PC4 family protein [Paracoccus sp. M09]